MKPTQLETKMFKSFAGIAVFVTLINVAFWGGLIFAALWALKHFGVI